MSEDSHDRPSHEHAMRVNRFDQVSSLLLALLLFVGVFVMLLFLVWLFERLEFKGKELVLKPVEQQAGRGSNAPGFERDFEPPGAEEVEELMEPTLEDTITAVTEVASSVAASLDTFNTTSNQSSQGAGAGDSRPAGPEGEGVDIVPPYERWQLKFTAKNINGYAAQLDSFGIELGAFGGSSKGIDYANSFSGSPSTYSRAGGDDEERIWFRWTDATEFTKYDRQLLQRAGIAIDGRYVLMFISKELEAELYAREMAYANEKGFDSVRYIAKTVFEVEPTDEGFQFVVIDQRYRKVS